MSDLSITYRSPADLMPREGNPRIHSEKQTRQLANSIATFGFTMPVLVDGADRIIAGHARVEAAKLLSVASIPTIKRDDLTEAQCRQYLLTDNKLAENSAWDRRLLAMELQTLSELDVEFDLTLTGFETEEIDALIEELSVLDPDSDPGDEVPDPDLNTPPVTQLGDVWEIGKHRLICGDATDPAVHALLLNGERAQMVLTDPPYNVRIDGHVSGLGEIKHREFAMASGEMTLPEFTAFLLKVFLALATSCVDGAILYVFMDWRHMSEVLSAGGQAFTELKNLCVWAKTNGGMGSLYRSQHELVFVFKSGTAPHINNVNLGRHGRYRTNLWTYAGVNTFGKHRDAELAMHPTVKPLALVQDAIKDCSRRGGIVLDAFAGSGTTLLAAHRAGRRGYGIELDPIYCDVIIRRLKEATGLVAVHAETGKTFAEGAAALSAATNATTAAEAA